MDEPKTVGKYHAARADEAQPLIQVPVEEQVPESPDGEEGDRIPPDAFQALGLADRGDVPHQECGPDEFQEPVDEVRPVQALPPVVAEDEPGKGGIAPTPPSCTIDALTPAEIPEIVAHGHGAVRLTAVRPTAEREKRTGDRTSFGSCPTTQSSMASRLRVNRPLRTLRQRLSQALTGSYPLVYRDDELVTDASLVGRWVRVGRVVGRSM